MSLDKLPELLRKIEATASETDRETALAMGAVAVALNAGRLIARFDLDGTLRDANDRFLHTFGYTKEQAIGEKYLRFCNGSDFAEDYYREAWEGLKEGKVLELASRCRNSYGAFIYLNSVYSPIKTADGRLEGVMYFATDLTAMRAETVEAESKLEAIGHSQGIIEFDLSGKILAANENFLSLMDYSLEEIQGRHHSLFVTKAEASAQAYKNFWSKLGDGKFDCGEYLRIGKNGRRVWLQATYNPVFDISGNPVKVVKFCMDITGQKNASLEAEGRWAALSAATCMAEIDRDCKILSMNENMLKAFGYSEEEVIGRPDSILLFDEEINSGAQEMMWLRLRDGEVVHGEFRRKGIGSKELWFDATVTPIKGVDGMLNKIIVTAHDVTAQKAFRLDLEGKMSAIERSQAVVEFDVTGRVLSANSHFLKLLGYQLDEIQGRHHRSFVAPEYAASGEYQAFWERLARGEYFSGEFKRIGRSGKEIWIQATYNPVLDSQGHVVKIIKFAIDVTEAKLRAAEFEAKAHAIDRAQAVIEFTLDGRVIYANRNFLAAMGYTLREIEGQHHSMFCSAEYTQSDEYRDFWLRLGEGQFISGRFQRVGKFNREVWIQASYNPVMDLNGHISKIVKYAYDVSKEVELERRIAKNTKDMSESVSELLASITLISQHSDTASETAKRSLALSTEGKEAVGKSLESIRQIEGSTHRVADIVKVIGEIAAQTNLLAFNAALEAARAGQHGVGFSVVASEVRKLAERCATAAKEIRELIQESVQSVSKGAEVSLSAAGNFESVLEHVNSTACSVSEIASATVGQRKLADRVTEMIETLSSTTAAIKE